MNRKMLITRPHYDDATYYWHEWSTEIINTAQSLNIGVLDLEKEKVTEENVQKMTQKQKPRLLVLQGHGDAHTVLGHNDEPILSTDQLSTGVVTDRIIHTIACEAGMELGPASVEAGANAFIGYEAEFSFLIDSNQSIRPLDDDIARPFFESANKAVIALLKGDSVQESFEKSQRTCESWIAKLWSEYPLEAPHILPLLLLNKASQVVVGGTEERLFQK